MTLRSYNIFSKIRQLDADFQLFVLRKERFYSIDEQRIGLLAATGGCPRLGRDGEEPQRRFYHGFGRKMMGPLDHANSAAVSFQEKWVVYQRDYEQAGPNVHSQPALLSPPPPSSPPVASPPSLQY